MQIATRKLVDGKVAADGVARVEQAGASVSRGEFVGAEEALESLRQ